MDNWLPIETVPKDRTPVLVFLERPMQHSRIHAAWFGKDIGVIGTVFAFDAPKATHWRRMVEGPDEAKTGAPSPALTRFYFYRSVMERQPTSTEEGVGIMAVVIPQTDKAPLAPLVDLQSRNDGASLTNVAERVAERVTKDLLAPAGIDPRTVSWVESDSEGFFYHLMLGLDADGKALGSPAWRPIGRTQLEDFLEAYPDVGQQAWDIAKGYISNQGW